MWGLATGDQRGRPRARRLRAAAVAGARAGQLRAAPGDAARRACLAAAAALCPLAAALLAPLAVSARQGVASLPPPLAARGLDVLPFPGTPDAAPGAKIDFPAIARGAIVSVRVDGSRSGPHRGRLGAMPGGGTAFAPARPFAPGERVTVSALLADDAAAAASGSPGRRRLRFSFRIERPAPLAPSTLKAKGAARAQAIEQGLIAPHAATGAGSPSPTQSFISAPKLRPPIVEMMERDPDTAAGEIFLDAQNSAQAGPYILNAQGQLLWFEPLPAHQSALDVRVQYYAGRPVLTYYQGPIILPGFGRGVGVLLNEHYQRIHTITAGDGYYHNGIDLHELTLVPGGKAFVTVYAPVRADLSSVGGPRDGVVLDSIIQEIRISDNSVLWEWSALGHVPLSDSYAPPPRGGAPYDFFHINSIQLLPDGELIVSARHTWTVYSINMRTGAISWELGGKRSSFSMGPGTSFEWQHDAELHNDNLLTLFDDGAGLGREESQSRALEIRLTPGRATLVRAYEHIPPVLASSQGNVQLLWNHNLFVGWGAAPSFSEYTQSGEQLFRAWFRYPVASYRAYRFDNWIGAPLTRPSIAARPAGGGSTRVYASWNGATQVAAWRVLTGPSRTAMQSQPVAQAPWSGFETTITVKPALAYVEVQALDSAGRVLGTSAAVPSSGGCAGPYC